MWQGSREKLPNANALNILFRSLDMPSTASSIEPSKPRSALPLPEIIIIVDNETQVMFAHIEIMAEM